MPFKNYSLTKGGQLTIGQILSPNFVTGVSGWEIRKDGSAEFNNLVIRGEFDGTDYVINSSGAFFYGGTPTAGNLLISIAPSGGSDAYGNAYNAGAYIYGPTGSFAGLLDNGTFAELQLLPPGPVTNFTAHPAVLSFSVNPGAVNEQMAGVLSSGQESSLDIGSVLAYSDSADGTLAAGVAVGISTGAFGSGIYASFSKTALTLFGIPMVIASQTIPAVTFIPSNAAHATTNAQVFAEPVNGGAADEQLLIVLSSGKESSGDDAALQMFSESADASVVAKAVIEFGGTVAATFTKTGVTFSVPISASNFSGSYAGGQSVSGWPLSGNPAVTTTGLLLSNGMQTALNSIYNALVSAGLI